MATTDELLEVHLEAHQSVDDGQGKIRNIERRSAKQISYNDFFWNYMNLNWPIILTEVSSDWKCRTDWISDATSVIEQDTANNCDQNPTIFFDYLKQKLGNCSVPVADCSTEYFNSHAKKNMNFHDFLDHWQTQIKARNLGQCSQLTQTTCPTTENLYLKDWHLKAEMPNYDFYLVPKHFSSDWLNEYLVHTNRDDYRFVYMGPKDTWTPFHADVFGSYSWSTNILGCKKWILLPPGEELKLKDHLGNFPFRINGTQLQNKSVKFFTILQEENEAIFVPSGWYHQVWNLTDTISVNHNWFNACNVQCIWNNLSQSMRQVVAEIDDCRQMDNFEENCQMVLRASFGMNYFDFLELLEFIAKRRVKFCNNGNERINEIIKSSTDGLFDKCTFNDYHIRYDLKSISGVLEMMLQDPIVSDSRAVLYRQCLQLIEFTKGL